MAIDDLLKGLSTFQQGMTQYGVGQGIARAQEQVNQVNQMQMKEMEKRQALTQISNDLMATLSGTGADPATIQQAAMPFVQTQLKNSQDMLTQAALSGDQDMLKQGRMLQDEEQRGDRIKQGEMYSQQRWNTIYSETQANKRAEMQADASAAKRERLPSSLIKPLNESRAFGAQADSLLKKFESDKRMQKYVGLLAKDPGKARSYFNTEMRDFRSAVDRYYLQFRKSMTGSAASEQEDALIRSAIANLDTNPQAFATLIRSHLSEEGAKYNAQLEPLVSQGYSTSGYEWNFGNPVAEKQKADRANANAGAAALTQQQAPQGTGMSTPVQPAPDMATKASKYFR
jgi:hypothetical protein